MCAFLVYGCTDSNDENSKQKEDISVLSKQLVLSDPLSNQELPLLTLHELLNASDVKVALASAAGNNNELLLLKWQNLLLLAADEVNLPESERVLIEGEQGLRYLAYQGMKSNYQAAFQTAFVAFEDVDEVYRAYPAFEDLHERSVRLIEQRDALIESVANELDKQKFVGDAYKEAKRQWVIYIKSQPPFSNSK